MSDRAARVIQAKVEAAFERYSGAVLAGGEATPERFIEALKAEGLSLSIAETEAVVAQNVGGATVGAVPSDRRTGTGDRRTGAGSGRRRPVPIGRRSLGLLGRRVRGLS